MNSGLLQKNEETAFRLRGLYRSYGYQPYNMSKFEEYDLYVRNKSFLLSENILTFTDIDTDGTLSGPPFQRLAALQQAVGCDIIASGGVSSNEDLNKLAGMGLYGAIVGKAYYAGKVDLARAVREVQP